VTSYFFSNFTQAIIKVNIIHYQHIFTWIRYSSLSSTDKHAEE